MNVMDKLPKEARGSFVWTLLQGRALEIVEHLADTDYTRRMTATKSSSNFWMKGGRRKNGAKRWVSTYWRSLPYVNGAAVPGSALTVAKERQVCLSLKKLGQLGDGSCYNAVA